jgi:hypothetical protein
VLAAYEHTAEEQAALNRVCGAYEAADKVRRDLIEKWERFYKLYRGFQEFKSAWVNAGARDRDGVIWDARQGWGARIHIPIVFETVESTVPRVVSQRPRMLLLPGDEESEGNLESMQTTIDVQQHQIDYDLTLQDVAQTGYMYGLGAQKVRWREEWILDRPVEQHALDPRKYVLGEPQPLCTFDDPDAEWVDIWDFFWDPFARDMRTARWVLHRTWKDDDYVFDRLRPYAGRPPDWGTTAAQALSEEDVRGMGGAQRYGEVWTQRARAAGMSTNDLSAAGMHEVWEFHDGHRVLTVLDREVLVQDAENPTLGHIPFQIFRPHRVPGEMAGIGCIEPLEHLNYELDTLRSQRRDNATLKLMQSYAYDSGVVDEDDIVFGPGALVDVNGPPRDAIYPLSVGDIPNSSYQEESALLANIRSTAGLDDQNGGDGPMDAVGGTATGVQLVQAAASRRIQRQARNLEAETIRNAARCFIALNQRKLLSERARRVSVDPGPEAPANTKRWQFFTYGPEDYRGQFDPIPEGGSTQPDNVPQMRADATMLNQMFGGDPGVDQQRLKRELGRLAGVEHFEHWLVSPERVPPGVLEKLKALGVPDDRIQLALQMAQQEDQVGGQQPQAPATQQPQEGQQ